LLGAYRLSELKNLLRRRAPASTVISSE
jgi:hypothetical protein